MGEKLLTVEEKIDALTEILEGKQVKVTYEYELTVGAEFYAFSVKSTKHLLPKYYSITFYSDDEKTVCIEQGLASYCNPVEAGTDSYASLMERLRKYREQLMENM